MCLTHAKERRWSFLSGEEECCVVVVPFSGGVLMCCVWCNVMCDVCALQYVVLTFPAQARATWDEVRLLLL